MSTLKIRESKNSDSEKIKSIVFEVLREYGLDPDPGPINQDLDGIENCYRLNGGYFGVVEENGDIVATVGLYKLNENTGELRKMYVLPNQRGKGLGRKIMEFSLFKAKDLGFERVVLETALPFVEAIALYKKYGFTEYSPDHLSSRCDLAFELYL